MKRLLLSLILFFPAALAAQELHTFSNGEVADAEKINENFQYVLENATGSGGCSAEQDGSSVVITCADGTSGVLASEGTVVVYPEGGIVGESPVQSWPTGDIVWQDASGLYIGASINSRTVRIDGYKVGIENDATEEKVNLVGGSAAWLWFLTEDCTGQIFIRSTVQDTVHKIDTYYVADPSFGAETLLAKSYIVGNGYTTGPFVNEDVSCKESTGPQSLLPGVEYQFAAELQNLSFPAEQVQIP